jgi:hypothetical protein
MDRQGRAAMISTTQCAGCSEPIKYLRTEAGHWMPVNPDSMAEGDTKFKPGVHVSHFATCSHAAEFRRRNKNKEIS